MAPPQNLLQEHLDKPGELDLASLVRSVALLAGKMDQIVREGDDHKNQLREISDTLHKLDKRLAVFESNSVASQVKGHEQRLAKLEAAEQRQIGALGTLGWLAKNWPALIGFGTLAAVFLKQNGVV